MLTDVATLNAMDVCPEGKAGLPAGANLSISGWVINGRSRLIPNFNEVVRIVLEIKAPVIINAFRVSTLSFFINPMASRTAGVPMDIGEVECVIPRKV